MKVACCVWNGGKAVKPDLSLPKSPIIEKCSDTNAGVMLLDPVVDAPLPEWQLQFATNFLEHFALTTGLHAALAAASSEPDKCCPPGAVLVAE